MLVKSTTPSPAAPTAGPDAVPTATQRNRTLNRPPAHRHPAAPVARQGSRASSRRDRRTGRRRRSTPGSPVRAPRPTAGPGRRPRGAARPSRRACRPTAGRPSRHRGRLAQRARSGTVVHSCPAGAIAPASCSGSGSSTSANGWTASPARRRSRRAGGRAGHAERLEQLLAHDVEPAAPVVHLEEAAQGGVPDVGVVETAPGPEPLPDGGGDQGVPVAAGRALPPRPGRLGLGARGVGEQLLDADVVEGRARHVRAEPVGQVEPPGVAKSQHAHRDEGLGDRAHPVLRVVAGRPWPSARPSTVPAAPLQTSWPPRTRPAATDGSRPSRWAVARRWSSRAEVAGCSGIRPP